MTSHLAAQWKRVSKGQPAQVDLGTPEGQAFLLGELSAEVGDLKQEVARHKALIDKLIWKAAGGAGLVVALIEIASKWL